MRSSLLRGLLLGIWLLCSTAVLGQQKLRDNAGEFQGLSPEEQAWALSNPDAVRQLGNLSEAERRQLLDLYRNTDPATQRRLRAVKP